MESGVRMHTLCIGFQFNRRTSPEYSLPEPPRILLHFSFVFCVEFLFGEENSFASIQLLRDKYVSDHKKVKRKKGKNTCNTKMKDKTLVFGSVFFLTANDLPTQQSISVSTFPADCHVSLVNGTFGFVWIL